MPLSPPPNALTACQKCGECCRRYAISVLPSELAREAAHLKLDIPAFTALYTRLLVQVVPFSSGEHPLALNVSLLPKTLWEKLRAAGFDSNYAMILPMLGFKKREYCVFFDPKTFGCTIHSVKPEQCSLFPFTSLNENEDYAKAYDFCELATITSPTRYTNREIETQRIAMRAYFDAIAEKGLRGVWTAIPSEGDVVFRGKTMRSITLTELESWLSWHPAEEKKTATQKARKKKEPH